MKIFRTFFLVINLAEFLCCASIPLLAQKKRDAQVGGSFVIEHSKDIVASVGGKSISVREFRERSEFTVRPQNYKDKYITLNNLILEKILSLEAEQDKKSKLNSGMQSLVDGIKEQQMRAQLFYKTSYDKVKPKPDELKKAYALSTREYELEFYRLPNKKFADRVDSTIHSSPEKSDILFKEIEDILGKTPLHTTKFEDSDDDAIHKALYTNSVDVGKVIGPVKLADGGYIVMKVVKWTDFPLISGEEQQARWNKVHDIVHLRKAEEQWRSYQANVMKGKRLTFDKHSFEIISTWAMQKYLENKKFDTLNILLSNLEIKKPEFDLGTPFFSLDGRIWTLKDIGEMIRTHPLVYRTTTLDSANFRQQFRLSIIDLVRDHYLTKEAYKRSLDKNENVQNIIRMWKDSFLASNKAKNIIDEAVAQGAINKNDQKELSEYWNSKMNTLQKKYGHKIWINHELLDRLELTKIDMIAMKPGFPYPLEVPQFPALMPSRDINYAKLKKLQ